MTEIGADHGARLTFAESEIKELRRGQDVIFGKLDQQGGKLDQVATMLTEMRAQRGPGIKDTLDIASRILTIGTLLVGAIVYFASNGLSKDAHNTDLRVAKMEWQMERVEKALNWKAVVKPD